MDFLKSLPLNYAVTALAVVGVLMVIVSVARRTIGMALLGAVMAGVALCMYLFSHVGNALVREDPQFLRDSREVIDEATRAVKKLNKSMKDEEKQIRKITGDQ